MPLINLNIYADFVARRKITTPNAAGTYAASSGVVNWAVRISLTQTGAAVGSLTGTATEYTTAGFYQCVFDTADLVTALLAYVGRNAYLIWSRPGDANNYVTPVRITDRTVVEAA